MNLKTARPEVSPYPPESKSSGKAGQSKITGTPRQKKGGSAGLTGTAATSCSCCSGLQIHAQIALHRIHDQRLKLGR